MYARRPTVAIWPGQKSRMTALASLADSTGCIVLDGESLAMLLPADFLLADLSSEMEHDDRDLSGIADYLHRYGARGLIWTDLQSLDALDAALPYDRRDFIMDGDEHAVPILMGALDAKRSARVQEGRRNSQFESLHRISDELAAFAKTIARMAEDDEASSHVRDKPISFRPAPIGTFQPFGATPAAPADLTATTLREIIKLRRMREEFFDSELFADPAWDILLDLLAAQLDNQKVSVSSLCIAAAVPPTTALRWIGAMTDGGLLTRTHDPDDARRIFIGLSPDTAERLQQYFADVGRRVKPI